MRKGRPSASSSPIVQRVIAAGKAEWGGIKYVTFSAEGGLKTPWGDGKWGDASSAAKPDTIWAEFIGQVHMLTFRGSAYESTRCSDGEKVSGTLA
eukprot:2432523-Prymnesium_polylepis.1